MRPVLIAFSDHFGAQDLEKSLWVRLLRPRFDPMVTNDLSKAELLIYGDNGISHRGFKGRKIYVTGENMRPDYNECDFAITSCLLPNESRHCRIPYFVFAHPDPLPLIKPSDFVERTLAAKSRFCCFVATNPRAPERNRFFKILNRQRRVDSGGRHFNNINGPVANKAEFVAHYKFVIAFENTMSPGYTTEKLVEAMLAGAVPIYWGNPDIGTEFNTRSFINAADFSSLEALADHVLRVDSNESLYLNYLREPWFIENTPPKVYEMDRLSDALTAFVAADVSPGRRIYRNRRLREHVHGSPLKQSIISLRCRTEGWLWKMGIRG